MNLITRHVFNPVRDFIYPPLCFVCKRRLEPDEDRVCTSCWKLCVTVDGTHSVCQLLRSKFAAEGYVSDFISCFLFEKEGVFQEIIHLLKYRGVKSVGIQLGRKIGIRKNNDIFPRADFLVPIPLHRRKKRERGYNQSNYICRGISEVTGIPVCTSILFRSKDTKSQTLLDMQQRKENVSGAFTIKEKHIPYLQDKIVILVDDVITTGSTINACAKVLLQRHATKIFAASAALAA